MVQDFDDDDDDVVADGGGGGGKQAMGTDVGSFSMPTSVLAGASDCPDMNTMVTQHRHQLTCFNSFMLSDTQNKSTNNRVWK